MQACFIPSVFHIKITFYILVSWNLICFFVTQGRLVNIQNYSLNTIASVMKKFLRKIPGGIFGPQNEAAIFNILKMEDSQDQMKAVNRLIKYEIFLKPNEIILKQQVDDQPPPVQSAHVGPPLWDIPSDCHKLRGQ